MKKCLIAIFALAALVATPVVSSAQVYRNCMTVGDCEHCVNAEIVDGVYRLLSKDISCF